MSTEVSNSFLPYQQQSLQVVDRVQAELDNKLQGLILENEFIRQKYPAAVMVAKLPTDYRNPEYVKYFKSKEINKLNVKEMASNLLISREVKLNDQIKSGLLKVSDQSKSIQDLKRQTSQGNRADKMGDILGKKSRLQVQLKAIQNQLKDYQQVKNQLKNKNQLPPPPAEHKQFVQRMIKARKVAENKRKIMLQYEQNKQMQAMKKEQQQLRLSSEKKRTQKQKQLKTKKEQTQKQKQIQRQERLQSIKKYKSVIEQKRRHEIMKEKYQSSILFPMLQQKKKALQQRSERFKGYSIQDIHNFQKQYNRAREAKSLQHNSSEQQWTYKPPAYSPRIYKMLEEQKMKQRIRIQQKKRQLQQKIQRRSNYVQYVKEAIPIKIDEKKKLQLQQKNSRVTKKQKTETQTKSLGNKYMMEVKGKIKSEIKKENYSMRQESKQVMSKQQKKKLNTSMSHQEHDKYMREANHNRINRIISSNSIQKQQKLQKLKVQVDKMSQRVRRKQQMGKVTSRNKQSDNDLQELLSSIKAKVGMMQIYNG